MSTKIILTMPQPGETITQGAIVRWLVSVGNPIKEGDSIVELETEKAVFEYESPYEGKLVEILAKAHAVVPVGDPIAVFEVSDEKASKYLMLGIGRKAEEKNQKKGVRGSPKGFPKVSPLVRTMMREHGIDSSELTQIHGIGPGGRITKENILAYLTTKKGGPAARNAPQDGDVEIIPVSPVRLRIAENMVLSKKTIPHAHSGLTVDLTEILKNRQKISILALIFPALREAIEKHPLVNASFRDEGATSSILLHKKINLGVAVDVGRGLYIVVVKNAEKKNAETLHHEVSTLVEKAKENKLTPADLTGMTFTFNNFGFYGTTLGVQIIPASQSTILGMGKIESRPWVMGDRIEIRKLADFTLAFDHRILDGREAGLFLSDLKELLET